MEIETGDSVQRIVLRGDGKKTATVQVTRGRAQAVVELQGCVLGSSDTLMTTAESVDAASRFLADVAAFMRKCEAGQ